jgi:hypothetical protein
VHGGSGYSFSRADCLEMDWAEFCWYVEHAGDRREAEANAIRNASQK